MDYCWCVFFEANIHFFTAREMWLFLSGLYKGELAHINRLYKPHPRVPSGLAKLLTQSDETTILDAWRRSIILQFGIYKQTLKKGFISFDFICSEIERLNWI
jgi:hypothetical protein